MAGLTWYGMRGVGFAGRVVQDDTAPVSMIDVTAAFPAWLAADVRAVSATLPPASFVPHGEFVADVWGERVRVPVRIYDDEPSAVDVNALTVTQRAVLHCLYSRHGNGYVRQRNIERVLESSEPWVAPFVVHLVGEYVVEIVEVIQRGVPHLDDPHSLHSRMYAGFAARNPRLFALVEQRSVSYWSCYYRQRFPDPQSYPARAVLDAFRGSRMLSRRGA